MPLATGRPQCHSPLAIAYEPTGSRIAGSYLFAHFEFLHSSFFWAQSFAAHSILSPFACSRPSRRYVSRALCIRAPCLPHLHPLAPRCLLSRPWPPSLGPAGPSPVPWPRHPSPIPAAARALIPCPPGGWSPTALCAHSTVFSAPEACAEPLAPDSAERGPGASIASSLRIFQPRQRRGFRVSEALCPVCHCVAQAQCPPRPCSRGEGQQLGRQRFNGPQAQPRPRQTSVFCPNLQAWTQRK